MKKNILGSILAIFPALVLPLISIIRPDLIVAGNGESDGAIGTIEIWLPLLGAIIGVVLMNLNVKSFFKILGGLFVVASFFFPLIFALTGMKDSNWHWLTVLSLVIILAGIAGIVLLAMKKKSAN